MLFILDLINEGKSCTKLMILKLLQDHTNIRKWQERVRERAELGHFNNIWMLRLSYAYSNHYITTD